MRNARCIKSMLWLLIESVKGPLVVLAIISIFLTPFVIGAALGHYMADSDNEGCCCTVRIEPCRESHLVDNCTWPIKE